MNRVKYKIPRIKKLGIRFDGIEPIFLITYKTASYSTTNWERGLFYPIHRLIGKFKLRMQYYDFKRSGIEPESCEGCGEGWATWMIDEPNGEPYSITCCDGCVSFYDWKMTRRKINFFKQKIGEKENDSKTN